MQKEFEMFILGEFSFFLGLDISQFDKDIFISQTKYIKEMLKKFRMDDCALVNTPMVTDCKLSKDVESLEENQTLYRSVIRNLLYLKVSRC
jgi:hypothetical protein